MSAASLGHRLSAAAVSLILPLLFLGGAAALDNTAGQSPAASVAAAPLSAPLALTAPLTVGDVAVTGFSGAKLATTTIPAGVDPLAETVIDPDGASLRIFDLSTLGGPTVGQVVTAPVKLAVPASQIGQVFGMVFDDGAGQNGAGVPNLYVAATSAYGLQIVSAPAADGSVTRLAQGAPGAKFMAGQFGGLPGGSPGAIYKIDGSTGAVSLLADTAFSGVPNSGPGVGDLAFDPTSRNLYASDLDTGLIHRFDLSHNAADLGQFDHGMSGRPGASLPSVADDGKVADIASPAFNAGDPSTWGFTQPERRVEALAVHDGRLYYSVADGPTIWSVALGPDGSFDTTARLELQVKAAQPFAVTDIVFDPQGRMILAQRGALQSPFDYAQFTASGGAAETLRYTPVAPGSGATGLWQPDPEEFPIGLPPGSRMSAGGITLANGYNPDGTLGGTCQQTLITTGDDLRDNPALTTLPAGIANLHGIQINDTSLIGAANTPPLLSAFVQFDPNQANPQSTGHVGDVEAVPCTTAAAPPPQPGVTPPGIPAPATPATPQTPPGNNPATPPTNPGGGGTVNPNPGGGGTVTPGALPGGGGTVTPGSPGGGGGTTSPAETVGGVTFSKSTAAATCTDTDECLFTVHVQNTSNQAVPGPLQLVDTMSSNGTFPAGTIISTPPGAPWTCAPLANQNAAFACANPNGLAPGQSADFTIGLKFNSGQAIKEITNCLDPKGADKDVCVSVPTPGNTVPAANPTPPTTNTQPSPGEGVGTTPNGLSLIKRAVSTTCSDTGGGCQFDITFSNNGTTEFDGPITLTDVMTTSDGKPLAAASLEGGVAVTFPSTGAPSINCGPGNNGSFTCSTPPTAPAKVPPGGKVIMQMTFKPGASNGATSINNCVSIQGGPQNVCASMPLSSGPLLRASKVTAAHSCVPNCTFAITITNIGNADWNGVVVFNDGFSQTNGDIAFSAIDPTLTCATPVAGKAECHSNGSVTLKPGQAITGRFIVTGAVKAQAYSNCVFLTGNQVDNSSTDKCATILDQTPAPGVPLLKITKSVANLNPGQDGECPLGGPCNFTIDVENIGTAPYTGTVEIDDAILTGGGADESKGAVTNDPNWVCLDKKTTNLDGAGSQTGCINSHVQLAPGEHSSFGIVINPGAQFANVQGGAGNIMTNCVQIAIASGIDLFSNVQDHMSCARVKLDPFNVKIQKTGDTSCAPDTDCHFTLTLFNNGPIDHDAPVVISDKLNIGTAPIVSIDPPLPCATQPTQVPFTCTSAGDFPLPIGASHTYQITVHLPPNAASFQNCGTVAGTSVGGALIGATIGNNAGKGPNIGSATSCWSTTVAPAPGSGGANPSLQPATPPVTTPSQPPPVQPSTPPATCFSNMVPNGQGGCACPPNTFWDGSRCSPGSGGSNGISPAQSAPPHCPVGTTGTYPNCIVTSPTTGQPSFLPSPSQPRLPSPLLLHVCPAGTVGVYPNCRPFVGNGGTNGIFPSVLQAKVCPAGTVGVYPNCRPFTGTGGTNGTFPSVLQAKVCPPGMVGTFPNCQCPPGTRLSLAAHTCVSTAGKPVIPSILQKACPAGMVGVFPNCQCPPGTGLSPLTHTCSASAGNGGINGIPSSQQKTCPTGMVGVFPNCQCPTGTRLSFASHTCVSTAGKPATSILQKTCTGGMVGTYPDCQCPAGTRFSRALRRCIATGGTVLPSQPKTPTQPTTPVSPSTSQTCPTGQRFDIILRRCVSTGVGTPTPPTNNGDIIVK